MIGNRNALEFLEAAFGIFFAAVPGESEFDRHDYQTCFLLI